MYWFTFLPFLKCECLHAHLLSFHFTFAKDSAAHIFAWTMCTYNKTSSEKKWHFHYLVFVLHCKLLVVKRVYFDSFFPFSLLLKLISFGCCLKMYFSKEAIHAATNSFFERIFQGYFCSEQVLRDNSHERQVRGESSKPRVTGERIEPATIQVNFARRGPPERDVLKYHPILSKTHCLSWGSGVSW